MKIKLLNSDDIIIKICFWFMGRGYGKDRNSDNSHYVKKLYKTVNTEKSESYSLLFFCLALFIIS